MNAQRASASRHPGSVVRWALIAMALLVAVLAGTELLFYFPLTPLQLGSAEDLSLPTKHPGWVRMAFVGDILLGDAGRGILERRGTAYPFAALAPLIHSCDAAVGNLEGPIAVQAERNRGKRWAYKMDPRAATALARAGFTAVTLANNHILDCGPAGILETRRFLGRSGVRFFGAGRNDREASQPLLLRFMKIQVALLGYLAPYQLLSGRMVGMGHLGAGPDRPGAALATADVLRRDLAQAHSEADIVIVFLHMGDRYQTMPTEFERALAHDAIESGADAVMACGTHMFGPVEQFRGKPIVYSLGNFTFGSGNVRARFSQMAFLDVSPTGRWILRLAPIYTVNWNPMVWFQPKLLTGWMRNNILGRLSTLSGRLGTSVLLGPGWGLVRQ